MIRETCDLNWVEEKYRASEFTTPVIAARPTRRVLENGLELGAGTNGGEITCFLTRGRRILSPRWTALQSDRVRRGSSVSFGDLRQWSGHRYMCTRQ